MPIDLQYDIVDNTPAAAGPVEANFNRVEQYINQELIARDGHVAMTGQLRLFGPPISELDAAPKSYVDQVLPIGVLMSYGGAGTPAGGKWLVCDGASYATADYPELFAVIANTYGGSAGAFNVPNLGGRMAMGVDGSHVPGSTGGTADSVGVGPHAHAMDHTHGGATTSAASGDHVHGTGDHTHGFAHNHAIGNHRHTFLPSPGTSVVLSQSNVGSGLSIQEKAGPNQWDHNNTTGDQQSVTSTVTQNTSTTTGMTAGANTGGQSANHTHTVSIPGVVASTGPASATAINGNLPPYVALTMIIRAR